jgi:hypothetical protein
MLSLRRFVLKNAVREGVQSEKKLKVWVLNLKDGWKIKKHLCDLEFLISYSWRADAVKKDATCCMNYRVADPSKRSHLTISNAKSRVLVEEEMEPRAMKREKEKKWGTNSLGPLFLIQKTVPPGEKACLCIGPFQ